MSFNSPAIVAVAENINANNNGATNFLRRMLWIVIVIYLNLVGNTLYSTNRTANIQ